MGYKGSFIKVVWSMFLVFEIIIFLEIVLISFFI